MNARLIKKDSLQATVEPKPATVEPKPATEPKPAIKPVRPAQKSQTNARAEFDALFVKK
jgi:hypothetical protein